MNVNECSGICIIITSLILLSLNFFSKLHSAPLCKKFEVFGLPQIPNNRSMNVVTQEGSVVIV